MWYHQAPKTLGVFDLNQLGAFYQRWEALSAEMSRIMKPQNDTTFFTTLTRARAATAGFRGGYDRPTGEPNEVFSFMDIGSFLEVFSNQCNPDVSTPLYQRLNATKKAYQDLVVKFGKGPLTPQNVTGVTVGWISRKRFLQNPGRYTNKLFGNTSISRTAETPLYDTFLHEYLYYNKSKDAQATKYSVCGCVGAAAVPPDGQLMWNQSVELSSDGEQVLIAASIAPSVDAIMVEFGLDITSYFVGDALLDDDTLTVEASKSHSALLRARELQDDLLENLKARMAERAALAQPLQSLISPAQSRAAKSPRQTSVRRERRLQQDAFVEGDYTDDYVLMFGGFLYPDYDCDTFSTSWDKHFFTFMNATDDAIEDFVYVYRGSSGENTMDVFFFPESAVSEEMLAELQNGMDAYSLSIEDVEEMGGLWSELFFENDQLQEWGGRIPLDLLALYAPSPDGSYSQTAPSEGGIILPIMYVEAVLEGFVVLDYLIGGLSGSIIEWGEDLPIEVAPVSAADVTFALGLDKTVIDLLAFEYTSEGEEPKQQFDYYVLVHGVDGEILEVEKPENSTVTDTDLDEEGSGSREQPENDDGDETATDEGQTTANSTSVTPEATPAPTNSNATNSTPESGPTAAPSNTTGAGPLESSALGTQSALTWKCVAVASLLAPMIQLGL